MADNFIWDNKNHTYAIAKESLVDIAKKNMEDLAKIDYVILNDEDLKRAKVQRANINNAVKSVADARKQMSAVVLAQFVPQCKEIEAYGTKLSADITKKINDYVGTVKKKTYTFIIKTDNLGALKKLEKHAVKYQLEPTIKED